MAIRVGDDADTLVDFTVGGVCCKAHWSYQGVRGGIADYLADDVKGRKHQVFEASSKVLVGLGFDSRGGMSKTTRDFHKRLFGTAGWRSKALCAWVQRTHLTRLSANLWKYRGMATRFVFDKHNWLLAASPQDPPAGSAPSQPSPASSGSSSGSGGRVAPSSSQSSLSFNASEEFAAEMHNLQGGGSNSSSSLSQGWV